MSKKPLINDEGEVRELLASDFKKMRPAKEVLSPELYAILTKRGPGERGPQVAPVKQQVTLRLDQDVLAKFKDTGAGWQSRINDALRKSVIKPRRRSA
jgi:uncharacterized protein (DUF4415 family)